MVTLSMVAGTTTNYLAQEESWLGGPLGSVSIFGGQAGWADWYNSLSSWMGTFGATGKDILWAVPLIPIGASLGAAANGSYDDKYLALARKFVATSGNDDQIYIRLGWEFNAAGYNAWDATGGQAQNYAQAFQHVVDAFRSVSDKFRFEWTPNKGDGGMNPEDAYPGDQYVDVIGMDFYWDAKQSWSITDPVKAWNYFVNEKYGLQWHQDFAAAHNKPTAYAEWGVNTNNSAAYIKLAAQWFDDHNVLYQNYWNSNSNFQGKLSDGQYPDAATAYKEAFSGDVGTGDVVVPDHNSWIGTGADNSYTVAQLGDVVVEAANGGTDSVYTAMNYTLPTDVENLYLTGIDNLNGTGNAGANTISGTSGNNVLSGLDGNDTLVAGAGADTLDGGIGADSMDGGDGNDLYLVDNAGDKIVELNGGGYDIVNSSASHTLAANVEQLNLTGILAINGTGNDGANLIIGNAGINLLNGLGGDDTLNGGAGADVMNGGVGDDRYIVENIGDLIVEANGGGIDTVQASVNYTLATDVENLELIGIYNLNGYGNALDNSITGNVGNNTVYGYAGNDALSTGAGIDYLNGGDGNDTLDGGIGADSMIGANGNDVYVVDNVGDKINEYYSGGLGGVDSVQSSVTFTLGTDIENLSLTGGDAINGTGNTLKNFIWGNAGANTLFGMDGSDTLDAGAGADTLYGGAGNDLFVFEAGEANGDILADFDGKGGLAGDSIRLEGYGQGAYATFGSGTLSVHYSGGVDVIRLAANLDASDYSFA